MAKYGCLYAWVSKIDFNLDKLGKGYRILPQDPLILVMATQLNGVSVSLDCIRLKQSISKS